MKKFKIISKIIFVLIFIYVLVRGFQFVYQNAELKSKLEIEEMKSDRFYGQLHELAFIFEKVGTEIKKEDIYNAIVEFREMRNSQLRRDSISVFEEPIIDIKNTKIIDGFHRDIYFIFDENGKLKNIEYEKYKPTYRRIH